MSAISPFSPNRILLGRFLQRTWTVSIRISGRSISTIRMDSAFATPSPRRKSPLLPANLHSINLRVFATGMEILADYLESIESWFEGKRPERTVLTATLRDKGAGFVQADW